MDRRKGLIASALTLLLTCLLCLGLYHWDNKYTRQDIQPINGVLFPGEDMAVSCLIRQWVLYPDVLLTPETVDHYEGYRCYTDIGAKKLQGTGSMTYRLTLMLSESPGDYALELPEIFSSCKLYINETLYLQLGDPDAKTEGISSQIVTFSAAGKTELLLSASDFRGSAGE